MAPFFRAHREPFKTLLIICDSLVITLVKKPIWVIKYALPFMRPRRDWSLQRTLITKHYRHLSWLAMKYGVPIVSPDHTALVAGQKGSWIDPVPNELILGRLKDMAAASGVEPVRLPGYWLDRDGSDVPLGAPPRPGEKVVFHLHGGAYVFLSANTQDPTTEIGRGLMERCESIGRVFSIEYRLAATPDNELAYPFPSQLLDALTAYYYLVHTVGFAPADIIVDGDSAGANLALALTRYLIETASDAVPAPPGRLLLLSPWCDAGPIRATPSSSWAQFAHIDCGPGAQLQEAAKMFCGPLGLAEAEVNPYISPASTHTSMSVSFKGFPRTFILCGGMEGLRDQIRVLRDRMVRDIGEENVVYCEPPGAIHDFLWVPWVEPERTNAWHEIANWLSR
ncbi:alpha/beta-hydrolase [Heliocybe sulcata]|uniref:Alpha/beta-hydrolase n=1 Tax=Heliocybe sulcata TaxID=5364 RepID=A0A5C3ND96_9AGAM|nr:alpha/beta-hydrolase [Heliocybe sulcata]